MGVHRANGEALPPRPGEATHCDPRRGGPEGCITCGDVAVELEVLEIDHVRELALCADDRDRRETVEIALVAPVEPGDRLLVHAATAIAVADASRTSSASRPGVRGGGPASARTSSPGVAG